MKRWDLELTFNSSKPTSIACEKVHEGLSGDHRSPHRGTRLRRSSARWEKTTPTSRTHLRWLMS